MKTLVILCLCWLGAGATAQEPFDLWMTSLSARGRIEVMAADAAKVQQLAFWAERSLKQLEKDWRTGIFFQMGEPLKIVMNPDVEGVTLQQSWQGGKLHQKLLLSETAMKDHPRELAEVFTRAMGYRAGVAAMPAGEKNFDWQVPDWLVSGSAHALLADRSRRLYEIGVGRYDGSSPPYPETMVNAGGREEDPLSEAGTALLCLWTFQHPKPEKIWTTLSQGDFRDAEVWAGFLPGVGNLRGVHQHWDVWWQEERNRLITEYAMDTEIRERLEEELIFLPAFYGLSMEGQNRYQRINFPSLYPYLDDPRFGVAMQEWIVRLQRLRFRQSPEFNEEVEQLQEAGRLAIRAAKAKGRKRERLWAEALEKSGT